MSGRRVVLVSMPWHRPGDPRTPLGAASIEAALAADGVDVRPLVFPVEGLVEAADMRRVVEVVADVAHGGADVAFGVYVWNDERVRAVLRGLRAGGFAGRVVLGGPQISYAAAGLEALYPEADLFVRGYAEQALRDLYAGDWPGGIPGVHVAGQPDRGVVAQAPLELLPSPYLGGAVPLDFEPAAARRFVRWETQRGCPYRCAFCQHREAGARLTRTRFLPDRLEAEVRAFVEAGVDAIAVLDPVFNTQGDHALGVLAALKAAGYRGHLSLQCRFEALDAAFLDALDGLDVTLELGLQTIHLAEGRAVQRFNRLDIVDRALADLRGRGVDHEVSLIYGLPEQTLASFRATVDWCLRRRVPRVRAFPLMLLRGTPLEQARAQWALEEDDQPIPAVVASSTFDRADHAAMARLAAALRATEDQHPPCVDALDAVDGGAPPSSSPRGGVW